MLTSETLDKALDDQRTRSVAAVGVLLIVQTIVQTVLFRLGAAVESALIFDGFWNLTYISVLATLVTGGLWAALAANRSFEQPWWMLVVGVFGGWQLLIVPLSVELPNFLANTLLVVGDVVALAAAVLALATLDRAIPRVTPGGPTGGAGAAAGQVGGYYEDPRYRGQHDDDRTQLHGQAPYTESTQPYERTEHYEGQQGAGQRNAPEVPPGWYPDPQGEAATRWWDGTAWSREVR